MLLAVGLRAQNKNIAYQDETVRFTIITDGAIRMEYAPNGHFVDNASQVAVIRDYPAVDFKVKEGKTIEITTEEVIESVEIIEQRDFEVLTDEQYEQIKKILSNETTK